MHDAFAQLAARPSRTASMCMKLYRAQNRLTEDNSLSFPQPAYIGPRSKQAHVETAHMMKVRMECVKTGDGRKFLAVDAVVIVAIK